MPPTIYNSYALNASSGRMLSGLAASSGIARGAAFVCSCGDSIVVPRRPIDASAVDRELERLDQAVTPLLFALGFIWMFMMGGFSGVMHAAAPADAQQHDSYFVVAHIHYVLIGGSLFAMLAGIHYWFPLITGRQIHERWGKRSFWVIFIGFNTTFFPMHLLGLNGMPRRTFTYDPNMGWDAPNFIATVMADALAGLPLIVISVWMWSLESPGGYHIHPRNNHP